MVEKTRLKTNKCKKMSSQSFYLMKANNNRQSNSPNKLKNFLKNLKPP